MYLAFSISDGRGQRTRHDWSISV